MSRKAQGGEVSLGNAEQRWYIQLPFCPLSRPTAFLPCVLKVPSISCPTLWNPMDYRLPGSYPLSMGFSSQEYQSGLPCPSPRDLLNPGIERTSLMSSALSIGFFATTTTREALLPCTKKQKWHCFLLQTWGWQKCGAEKAWRRQQRRSSVRLAVRAGVPWGLTTDF